MAEKHSGFKATEDIDMDSHDIDNVTNFDGTAKTDIDDAVTKKHTQNGDTALGTQSEDLDMGTHKISNVVNPAADQDAATMKYVDDNAGSPTGDGGTKVTNADVSTTAAISGSKILGIYKLTNDNLHSNSGILHSSSTVYALMKTITINSLNPTTAIIRVSFQLMAYTAGQAAYGRIYKNGSPVGTERSTTNTVYSTFNEDLEFGEGDSVQLYLKSTSGYHAGISGFQILGIDTAIVASFAGTNS